MRSRFGYAISEMASNYILQVWEECKVTYDTRLKE